jgi:hypothetical protein
MICTQCEKEIVDGSQVCSACGTWLESNRKEVKNTEQCSECGNPNWMGHKIGCKHGIQPSAADYSTKTNGSDKRPGRIRLIIGWILIAISLTGLKYLIVAAVFAAIGIGLIRGWPPKYFGGVLVCWPIATLLKEIIKLLPVFKL